MASADFCRPIPLPLGNGSPRQDHRPPRVMRVTFPLMLAAFTSTVSVQVSGFEDISLLTHRDRLIGDSCSSSQRFACGFLQIPPRGGHPCRSANRSPCRADSGLAPPSHPAHHHVYRNSASHGATRHAWRTKKNRGLGPRDNVERPDHRVIPAGCISWIFGHAPTFSGASRLSEPSNSIVFKPSLVTAFSIDLVWLTNASMAD